MEVLLGDIPSEFEGFCEIIRLDSALGASQDSPQVVDMSRVHWLAGNMCAALGAILERHRPHFGTIWFLGLRDDILHTVLRKNSFLSSFDPQTPKGPDFHETMIEYRRFDRGDNAGFGRYVNRQLAGKRIPQMTPALQYRFLLSIGELFENAAEHSETVLGVVACGQYFRAHERIEFAIADLGIGMRQSILRAKELDLSPEQAIDWAMSGESTIRRGKPGGHGLKLIREFIRMNEGRIQVASDSGYWSFHKGQVETRSFPAPFPGTMVNIEINSADSQKYCLPAEIDPDSIF